MHIQENWCLEKGRSHESVRTGRRTSLGGHEPVFLLKRRVLGGDSAGDSRKEEGPRRAGTGENWSGASSGGQRVPRVCGDEDTA